MPYVAAESLPPEISNSIICYTRMCIVFSLTWCLLGRLLVVLWSVSTLGRHTRWTMATHVFLASLLAPDLFHIVFVPRSERMHDFLVVEAVLLYVQMGFWMVLWPLEVPGV